MQWTPILSSDDEFGLSTSLSFDKEAASYEFSDAAVRLVRDALASARGARAICRAARSCQPHARSRLLLLAILRRDSCTGCWGCCQCS